MLGGDYSGKEKQSAEKENSDGAWVTPSLLRLCTTVEEAGNLVLGTFAETNRPVNQPERAMKDLMSQLDDLSKEFPKLEADLSVELSGFPKTVVSRKPEGK
jgi:hypothetical protein